MERSPIDLFSQIKDSLKNIEMTPEQIVEAVLHLENWTILIKVYLVWDPTFWKIINILYNFIFQYFHLKILHPIIFISWTHKLLIAAGCPIYNLWKGYNLSAMSQKQKKNIPLQKHDRNSIAGLSMTTCNPCN